MTAVRCVVLLLSLALVSLVLETAGFAIAAALTSYAMSEQPRKAAPVAATQPKPPKPGSVPKLPQTIFNLEKRGGSGNRSGHGGFRRTTRRPRQGRS